MTTDIRKMSDDELINKLYDMPSQFVFAEIARRLKIMREFCEDQITFLDSDRLSDLETCKAIEARLDNAEAAYRAMEAEREKP